MQAAGIMDSAFIIICALILNALLAGPRRLYEAVGLFALARMPARKLRDVERKLNREHRPERELEMRGYIVLVAGICAALAIGWLLQGIAHAGSRFVELFLLAVLLPVRPAADAASRIKNALHNNNIAAARHVFDGTPWRHHAVMDAHALARAAVETLSVHFSERIICPVLVYLLFGLPGMFAAMFVTLLHDTASSGAFGKAVRSAYQLLHWIPSRLAACLWIISTLFMPEGRIKQAAMQLWPLMATDTPQALAVSGAGHVMGLSLGGPSSIYAGGKWLGGGTPKAMPVHIAKALYLFAVLHVLLVIIFGLVL
jgi:adenosylcobinamide-phosphate synthase